MRVVLYKGRGFISRLIRWQTRGTYSHAAIRLSDGRIIEAWQGAGVRQLKHFKHGSRDVDFFSVKGLTPAHEIGVEHFLNQQLGKHYDYIGVARFVTRRRKGDPFRWFCSELVFASLKSVGINLFARTQAWEVSPHMLSRSPLLILTGPSDG